MFCRKDSKTRISQKLSEIDDIAQSEALRFIDKTFAELAIFQLDDNQNLKVVSSEKTYSFEATISDTSKRFYNIETNFLVNCCSIVIAVSGANAEYWIKVRYDDTNNYFITLENAVLTAGYGYTLNVNLPASDYFNFEIQCSAGATVSFKAIFYQGNTMYDLESYISAIYGILDFTGNTFEQQIDNLQSDISAIKSQIDKLTFDASNNLLCI